MLRDLAESVHTLAYLVSREYYSARREEVASIVQTGIQQVSASRLADCPDAFVQNRLSTQSDIVEQMRSAGGFALATVRDDLDRRLAIPYFCLDLALLRKTAGE